jgi:predicted nucleic acid-binding protein
VRDAVLIDTGPLVAFLNREDECHEWARDNWATIRPPLLTCEAVLGEACFLLSSAGGAGAVLGLLKDGVLSIRLDVEKEAEALTRLLEKYADVPMSLADACLVRMAEQVGRSVVFTLDSHFRIYRKHGRQVIPTLMLRRS